jgi:hypothetical protein
MSRKMVIAGVAGVLVGAGLGFFRFYPTDSQTATASQPSRSAEKTRGAKQIAPRFVASTGEPALLETNPGKPGYDPTRLRGVFSLVELYQREPRHEEWAKTIENHLAQGLRTDLAKLLPTVTLDSVECRYTLCRLVWRGPKSDESKLVRVIEVLYPAERMAFGRNVAVLAYKGPFWYPEVQVGDATSLINGMSAARSKQLEQIRRLAKLAESHGEKMPDQRIPDEAWPDK